MNNNFGCSGSIGPTVSTGYTYSSYPIPSGPIFYVGETLSSKDTEVIYYPYDDKDSHFKINGSIREAAALILRKALELKNQLTYQTDTTYVRWGPFQFITETFKPTMSYFNTISYSGDEICLIGQVIKELEKLQEMKAFW